MLHAVYRLCRYGLKCIFGIHRSGSNMKSFLLLTFIVSSVFVTAQVSAETPLPKDVQRLLADREACDHWRGEEPYDAERKAAIDWAVCHACTGTDARLAALKKKYHSSAVVMEKLNAQFEKVEPDDKAATLQFCKSTRKPSWMP